MVWPHPKPKQAPRVVLCHLRQKVAIFRPNLGQGRAHIDQKSRLHSLGPSTAAGIPPRAVQLYDRLRPDPGSPPDDDPTWQPDAVIVLLGHNDVLYAGRTRTPFAPRFADDYVDLVRALRRRYPRSLIVCTTGGMYQSRALALRQAWADALKRLQATDPRIVSHRFSAWSFLHPRAHTQARLADELTRLLAAQLGWTLTPADVAPPGATSDDQ